MEWRTIEIVNKIEGINNILYSEHYNFLFDIFLYGKESNCWKTHITKKEFIDYVSIFITGLMMHWCYNVAQSNLIDEYENIIETFIESI